jgi:hypothetical protein
MNTRSFHCGGIIVATSPSEYGAAARAVSSDIIILPYPARFFVFIISI